jgi:hypothetical protein
MWRRPLRLLDVQSQPLAAMPGVFQIFKQLRRDHALLHARKEVDEAGCRVQARIRRDPSNRLTGSDHVQPAAHASVITPWRRLHAPQ